MTKIIGISFVFLLAVISNIGYITLGQKERSYDELRLTETFYARRSIAAGRPFDIAGTALAVISCPMDNDPARPEDFSVAYMRPGGPDLKAYLEDEARHRSEIRKHQSEKNLALYLLGWGRHASAAITGTFAGRTKYSYTGMYREYPERYVLYDFAHKGKLYRVAFSYLEYRNYMHASASVFIWIVLISSAAVMAGFPLVFHVNLTRPLNALLAGVGKINGGDTASAVPVKFEDEIGFLTRSFNRMAESIRDHTNLLEFKVRERTAEVERLNGLKNRFLAIIAHDLKSPLKTLDFSIDSLVKGKKKGPSGDENIDTIKRTVDYMFRLLDDLSDIAMIESGRLDLQFTENDYGPFLRENIRAKRFAAERKNIEISAEIPAGLPKMFFDRNRINQVLDNLIENAIRYSDENTKITVTVEPLAKSVITRVIDRGRGIPEEDLDAIFEEYGTSRSGRKPSEKSTGLGLAIAKKIISAHHGDIGVESRVGEGSVFYFTLPVYEV
jgi:signal transduction histidine kinase